MIRVFVYPVLFTIIVSAYLFFNAPPPLPNQSNPYASDSRDVPVFELFDVVNHVNKETRNLWTTRIVTQGTEAGLKFEEHWLDSGNESGPLPALFMRMISENLEKQRASLGLFLGSDMPIKKANIFKGEQVTQFERLRRDLQPKFFSMEQIQLEVGMYPDIASSPGCVNCHNNHIESPKKDWKINEVMGAATWTYPVKSLSNNELHENVLQIYKAIEASYQMYIDKIRSSSLPIKIGDEWPKSNVLALPDTEYFMKAVIQATASEIVNSVYMKRSLRK